MNTDINPLVSVITPVYNGELYLRECIESVLKQTYINFEYIIVDNFSTDCSLEIATHYSKKDSRIKIQKNEKFVGIIENHNIAFKYISSASKYCKVVSADDIIFRNCLELMVKFGEENPSVGFIGSYQISGYCIKRQGFEYPRDVFSGREICRRILLNKYLRDFGFGSPTSLLYRSDIVRASNEFYPNSSPHADTSACFEHLKNCDYGFVYQVLSYERLHSATQSAKSADLNCYSSANINDIIKYGSYYLEYEELSKKLMEELNDYRKFLATNILKRRGKEFWDYHRSRLNELGYPIRFYQLLRALIVKIFLEITNPRQLINKIVARKCSFHEEDNTMKKTGIYNEKCGRKQWKNEY